MKNIRFKPLFITNFWVKMFRMEENEILSKNFSVKECQISIYTMIRRWQITLMMRYVNISVTSFVFYTNRILDCHVYMPASF